MLRLLSIVARPWRKPASENSAVAFGTSDVPLAIYGNNIIKEKKLGTLNLGYVINTLHLFTTMPFTDDFNHIVISLDLCF